MGNISVLVNYNGGPIVATTHLEANLPKGERIFGASITNPGMNGMAYDIDKMGYPLEHDAAPDTECKLLKFSKTSKSKSSFFSASTWSDYSKQSKETCY